MRTVSISIHDIHDELSDYLDDLEASTPTPDPEAPTDAEDDDGGDDDDGSEIID